jgi:biotin carboxylase
MKHAVFVAPFLPETTTRFVNAVIAQPEVLVGLVTHEPVSRLPDGVRAGIAAHVQVADAFDPIVLADAVQRIAARMGGRVDLLLGTLEQLQVPIAQVREHFGIPGMGAEAARNFRDKARMKSVLRAHGVPCARHRLVQSEAEALAFAAEVGYPLVAKPPAGAGAKSTHRLEKEADLRAVLGRHEPGPGREVLLEEFVVGEEHSFETVSIRGKAVWHSLTRYAPTPLHVLETPWIQWTVLLPREVDDPRYDDIRRVGRAALEALGMGTGVSHLEWFRRKDGSIAVSEVGARPPGAQICTLVSYAHDIDFYRAWGRLVVHERFEPPERRFAAGAAYLRGQGIGSVTAIHGLEQARQELGDLVVEARLPQPGQSPSGSYEGEGYVILRHPETAVVERALRRLITLVRVVLGGRA